MAVQNWNNVALELLTNIFSFVLTTSNQPTEKEFLAQMVRISHVCIRWRGALINDGFTKRLCENHQYALSTDPIPIKPLFILVRYVRGLEKPSHGNFLQYLAKGPTIPKGEMVPKRDDVDFRYEPNMAKIKERTVPLSIGATIAQIEQEKGEIRLEELLELFDEAFTENGVQVEFYAEGINIKKVFHRDYLRESGNPVFTDIVRNGVTVRSMRNWIEDLNNFIASRDLSMRYAPYIDPHGSLEMTKKLLVGIQVDDEFYNDLRDYVKGIIVYMKNPQLPLENKRRFFSNLSEVEKKDPKRPNEKIPKLLFVYTLMKEIVEARDPILSFLATSIERFKEQKVVDANLSTVPRTFLSMTRSEFGDEWGLCRLDYEEKRTLLPTVPQHLIEFKDSINTRMRRGFSPLKIINFVRSEFDKTSRETKKAVFDAVTTMQTNGLITKEEKKEMILIRRVENEGINVFSREFTNIGFAKLLELYEYLINTFPIQREAPQTPQLEGPGDDAENPQGILFKDQMHREIETW